MEAGHVQTSIGRAKPPLAAAVLAVLNTVPFSVNGLTYPTHARELLLRGLEAAGVEVKRDGKGFCV